MEIVLGLLVIAIIISVSIWLYISCQGDTNIVFLTEQKTKFVLHKLEGNYATFVAKVPFVNKGSQEGIIMDAFARHQLPREQYDAVSVSTRMTLEANPREDDYWEAVIIPIKKGGAVQVYVTLKVEKGTVDEALIGMVDMPIDLIYQELGRSPWQLRKARIILLRDEVKQAIQSRVS